jgi:hypothetical protein
MEQVGKAGEAEWNEGRRKRRHEAINATMRVGQLVTAVEDFTEWEDPDHMAELLEAFFKQMLEVAVLVGGIGKLGYRTLGRNVSGK